MTAADPRGRPVDILRRTYSAWMRVPEYPDPIRIRWYWVYPDDVPTSALDGYSSSDWDPYPHSAPPLGEDGVRRSPFRDWSDGSPPPWPVTVPTGLAVGLAGAARSGAHVASGSGTGLSLAACVAGYTREAAGAATGLALGTAAVVRSRATEETGEAAASGSAVASHGRTVASSGAGDGLGAAVSLGARTASGVGAGSGLGTAASLSSRAQAATGTAAGEGDGTGGPGVFPMGQGCQVRRSANQSITTSTTTALSFDAMDRDDIGASQVGGSNPTRLTANVAGWYVMVGQVFWASSSVNDRQGFWRVNGSSIPGRQDEGATALLPTPAQEVTACLYLNSGDYVELCVWQNSGGNLNVTGQADMVR